MYIKLLSNTGTEFRIFIFDDFDIRKIGIYYFTIIYLIKKGCFYCIIIASTLHVLYKLYVLCIVDEQRSSKEKEL